MIDFVNNRAVRAGDDAAKVFISGDVDEYMVLELIEDIELCKGAGIKHITFIINSPGGCVSDGMALYDTISSLSDIQTVAEIQGICASAATYAAMACDKITIAPSATMMIHEPTGGIAGNLTELEADMQYFVDLRNRIIAIYAARMAVEPAEVERIMGEAKFLDAQKCKDLHLVDEILGETDEEKQEEKPEEQQEEQQEEEKPETPEQEKTDDGTSDDVDAGTSDDDDKTENHNIFSIKNFIKYLKKNKISVIKAEDDEFAAQNDIIASLKNELATLKTEMEAKNKSYDGLVNQLAETKRDIDKRIQLEVCNRIASMGLTQNDLPQPSARNNIMDDGEFKQKLREVYITQGYAAAQNLVEKRENGEC